MNKAQNLILFMLIGISLYGQSSSNTSPFSFNASYIGDVVSNTSGGIKTGSAYLGMANIGLNFNTEKAGLWKGGEFYILGANTHGAEPTANLIGDFQTVSNIEAGNLSYIHEFWFKQNLGSISLQVGIQDLNADFVTTNSGANFINSSFGIPSVFADNIPSPIFPNTALGMAVFWEVFEALSIQTSVFDGNQSGFTTDEFNTKPDFDKNSGLQSFTELQCAFQILDSKSGVIKLGNYYHQHKSIDTEDVEKQKNDYGFYLLFDQQIYNENNDEGLTFFGQFAYSPNKENFNSHYIGGGLVYTGLLPKRNTDVLSVGMAHSGFNNHRSTSETTIELNYLANITDNIFMQPDLQYVISPSGTDVSLDPAIVVMLRFGLSF